MNKSSKKVLYLAEPQPALLGNVLLQLRDTNPNLFDEILIFFINEYSDTDKKIMSSIVNCTFVKYDCPLPDSLLSKHEFARSSKLIFARYEMFNLLDEYETVVGMDTDILIQGDISEIIICAEKTGFAMLCEDSVNKSAQKSDTVRTNFYYDMPGYDMSRNLYCAGTIAINRKLVQKSSYTEWCYEKTLEWADNLFMRDQAVLNLLIQEFDINVTPLNGSRLGTFPYYGRDTLDAKYIHSWGNNKFWNDYYLYLKYPKWSEYYNEWISLGGTPLDNKDFYPKLSIVVPVNNPNIFDFKECLNRLIEQEQLDVYYRYSDFEVILVSEPSNKAQIAEAVNMYNDQRFKLIFNETAIGIAESINRGLKIAKGKYVALINSYDIADKQRFAKQSEYLDKFPFVDVCVSNYNYFGAKNETHKVFDGNMSRAWSLITCPFDFPTVMLRKDFFVNNDLFFDEAMDAYFDWELWLRAFDKGMIVGCIRDVLSYRRYYNTNTDIINKTDDSAKTLIQTGFNKLGVDVSDALLAAISPCSGKVDKDKLELLKNVFKKAIEANSQLNIYDNRCLNHVFNIRLKEAETGELSEEVVIAHKSLTVASTETVSFGIKPRKFVHNLLRRLLVPIWKPISWRFYQPLQRIEQNVNNLQSLHLQIEALSKQNQKLSEALFIQNKSIDEILGILSEGKYDSRI